MVILYKNINTGEAALAAESHDIVSGLKAEEGSGRMGMVST